MIYKNIMVPFDGSDPSAHAMAVAIDLVGDDPEATIHVVSIIGTGLATVGINSPVSPLSGISQMYPDMSTYDSMVEGAMNATIEKLTVEVGSIFDDVSCHVNLAAFVAEKPADGICDYADENAIDMIIMGRRGLGAFRAMIGSVSYGVLHKANCPVVTVK